MRPHGAKLSPKNNYGQARSRPSPHTGALGHLSSQTMSFPSRVLTRTTFANKVNSVRFNIKPRIARRAAHSKGFQNDDHELQSPPQVQPPGITKA